MSSAILQYDFFPHYYIATKDVYETILCECLNTSDKAITLFGGKFSRILNQENKQPDVVVNNTNYELDFKLMISESLKEFQNITSPVVEEIAPGIKCYSNSKTLRSKVILLWNCCRNINEARLQTMRKRGDKEAKAITHFFDKVINQNKNILLFIPVFFSTVDKTLCVDMQYETIFQEISSTTEFIYKFRNNNQSGFDTFIIYVVNIPQDNEFTFVISKFTENGLEFIDKVRFFELESTRKLATENDCSGINFKVVK